MIEQQGNALKFLAYFVASKQGKTGLTVTCDVRNPAGTLVQTGASATEIGGGLYSYTLSSGSVTSEGEFTAIFKTSDTTVDQQHLPSLWVVGKAGVENLDAAVSTRNATTPPTTAAIRSELDTNSTKLQKLDANISTRATPDDLEVTLVAAAGEGSESYTCVSTEDEELLEGVSVWITTGDNPSTNVVAGPLISDGEGETHFLLDPGTYRQWEQLKGKNFNNPTIIEVEA